MGASGVVTSSLASQVHDSASQINQTPIPNPKPYKQKSKNYYNLDPMATRKESDQQNSKDKKGRNREK